MGESLQAIRPYLRALALFSLFLSVLWLTSAILILQVFDRVIPSQSQETLLVLIGAVIAMGILLLTPPYRASA